MGIITINASVSCLMFYPFSSVTGVFLIRVPQGREFLFFGGGGGGGSRYPSFLSLTLFLSYVHARMLKIILESQNQCEVQNQK